MVPLALYGSEEIKKWRKVLRSSSGITCHEKLRAWEKAIVIDAGVTYQIIRDPLLK